MPSPIYSANGIKVEGLREIQRSIIRLGVPREEMKAAAEQSAQVVLNEARSLVPVRSGKLRDSIRLTRGRSGFPQITAGNNRKGRAGVPYANPIHWGWFKRGIMPNPFFSNAIGLTREDVYKNYEKQIEQKIANEARKARSAMRSDVIQGFGYSNIIDRGDFIVGFRADGSTTKVGKADTIRMRSKLRSLGY